MLDRDQINVNQHFQIKYKPFTYCEVKRTNMKNERYVDTVDLSFNPLTKRLEVIRSNRNKMKLNLWSIDPDKWETGNWRLDTTLLNCTGKFYSGSDGFHPAGAVIDEKQGLQHIFIYRGYAGGPSGIFYIRRTLDTPKLKNYL